MNWHETIEFIRTQENFKDLVKDAYLEKDVNLNVQRFGQSEEFIETLSYIQKYQPNCIKILDIGAGNGISSINFALKGFEVTALEPDPSDTIGAKAILDMKEKLQLSRLHVIQSYAEEIDIQDETFDLVYTRQAMHHAHDLNKFISEASRLLKKGGILFTVRDHVVFDAKDKQLFLTSHPLQKFYGGENAYTPDEYKRAFASAKLSILEEFKYYDNVINYSPRTKEDIKDIPYTTEEALKKALKTKVGILANFPLVFRLYKIKNGIINKRSYYNERKIPGRPYSYIAKKI